MPHPECNCAPKGLSRRTSQTIHLVEYVKEESASHDMIVYAKDHLYEYLFRFLASELYAVLAERLGELSEYLFTYVPRSREKSAARGVDQSKEVAKRLAKMADADFGSLLIHRDTVEQKHLSAEERKQNTKRSYDLREKSKDCIRGRHIIVYDDVITTGATLLACVSLLKQAGAADVTVLTFGKTYRGDQRSKTPIV